MRPAGLCIVHRERHCLPADGPPLSRRFGRGTKTRSLAAGKAMRVAARTPPALMRLPMKVITPPQKPPRRDHGSRS